MIGLESAFGLVNKTLNKSKMDTKSIINLFTINPSKIINIRAIFQSTHARKPMIKIVMIVSLVILISLCKLEEYAPVYMIAA